MSLNRFRLSFDRAAENLGLPEFPTEVADSIRDSIGALVAAIQENRDVILIAFIAKFGCGPDEIVQITDTPLTGPIQWWCRKRTEEEIRREKMTALICAWQEDEPETSEYFPTCEAGSKHTHSVTIPDGAAFCPWCGLKIECRDFDIS